ncbi:hypothetical protein [Nostoc sp. KVJ20]|nr:hypothetical protein [Nostoc sp. KVJ20]
MGQYGSVEMLHCLKMLYRNISTQCLVENVQGKFPDNVLKL